ncbi:glycine betaine ABC transporter substrate-binding protein [Nocardioides terrisoli]|uniref:glycine betaine ABC transporter substrate-binding protein n=1 Tax=Nocardioides terrisoli TaxID=3388267 RepID=UPI00287B87C0|nr:glycine betaine ABC transporter substrate-binding protein [Nocardioides marmorisolisilvae]
MRTRTVRWAGAVAAVLAMLVTTSACASGNSETGRSGSGGQSGKAITIGYINWDEDIAVTHLWQKVLQDKGYDVKIQQVSDAGPTFIGLDKGSLDLFFDAWLPSTHKTYWDKYGHDLTDISTWYDHAPLTIAVPNYVDVKSMAELRSHGAEFDKTIIGIEPGAGLTRVTKGSMMPKYGLGDWSLKTSSTPAMLATLKKDIAAKKPVVVTLWRPHWAYNAFPIRDLTDPKGAMGKPDSLHAVGTGSFAKDFPTVDAMVKKFHMGDKELGSLEQSVLVKHKGDPAAGVDEWLKAHPDFVTSLG